MGKLLTNDDRDEPQAAQPTQMPQQRFLTPFLFFGNLVLALALMSLTSAAQAGLVMLDPTGVTTNMGAGTGAINNTINQSGLSSSYTSGVTDFTTFTTNTTSTGGGSNVWVSATNTKTGNVDFNLGGSYDISAFAFWPVNVNNSTYTFKDFTLLAADNSSFTGATTLGTYTAVKNTDTHAQVFNFTATTATYVRLEITSNFGAVSTGFNEAAFAEVTTPPPPTVPEPSSFALLGLGGLGLALNAYRRRRAAV